MVTAKTVPKPIDDLITSVFSNIYILNYINKMNGTKLKRKCPKKEKNIPNFSLIYAKLKPKIIIGTINIKL